MWTLSWIAKQEKERVTNYYCPCEAEGEYLKKIKKIENKGIHSFMSWRGHLFLAIFTYCPYLPGFCKKIAISEEICYYRESLEASLYSQVL